MKKQTPLLAISVAILFVITGCRSYFSAVPELVDEKVYPRNVVGDEISLSGYVDRNWRVLNRLAIMSGPAVQTELAARVADDSLRMELRLMYAMILANKGNSQGQEFLLSQYRRTNDYVIPGLFRLIYLGWGSPTFDRGGRAPVQKSDLKWAENLMLAALADTRPCTFEVPTGKDTMPVRELAVHYGNFDIILTQMKCTKAVPALCDFVRHNLDEPMFDGAFRSPGSGTSVVHSLTQWDDQAVEPVMLAVVHAAVQRESDVWALKYALDWLVKRGNVWVINDAVEGLGIDHVYSALVGSKNASYLDAIRRKLGALQDGDLTGCALFRQRTAKAHAELILIMGEEVDPVPKLMAFVDDSKNLQRHFAIYLLKELKDQRVVSWAAKKASEETDWFLPFCLIELLGVTPGHEATVALERLLEVPFDKIKPEEGIRYTSLDYYNRILEQLNKRTAGR